MVWKPTRRSEAESNPGERRQLSYSIPIPTPSTPLGHDRTTPARPTNASVPTSPPIQRPVATIPTPDGPYPYLETSSHVLRQEKHECGLPVPSSRNASLEGTPWGAVLHTTSDVAALTSDQHELSLMHVFDNVIPDEEHRQSQPQIERQLHVGRDLDLQINAVRARAGEFRRQSKPVIRLHGTDTTSWPIQLQRSSSLPLAAPKRATDVHGYQQNPAHRA